MTGQSTFPNFQYFDGMLEVPGWFIKKHVSKACPYHGPYDHVGGKFIQQLDWNALLVEEFLHDQVPEEKPKSKKQPIPPDGKITDLKNLGTWIPDY
jgi:hypothetical protein